MKHIALFLAVLGLLAAGSAAAPAPRLGRVIMVQRHGVRAPSRPPAELGHYSTHPWPDWPVAAGELTPHGAADMGLMGASLRAAYTAAGLLPAQACPATDTVFVWADNADQRTRASGAALVGGMFPGCGLEAQYATGPKHDPLFSTSPAKLCPFDADAARDAIVATAGGDLDRPDPAYPAALEALQKILAPGACDAAEISDKCLLNRHNTLRAKGPALRLEGPLATGAMLSEALLLEYAEGMPDAGWGRAASERSVASVMPLHRSFTDLLQRTPYMAARSGARLAREILDTINGRPGATFAGEIAVPPAARAVTFLGHDANLANLAALLGVAWDLPGQPDPTAPDTALAFEVWEGPGEARFVKLRVYYQTLADLRDLTPLDAAHPAGRLDLPIPGCADGPDGMCAAATLTRLLESRLEPGCFKDGGTSH